MTLRLLILVALAAFMVGCGEAGADAANGDTRQIRKEIPASKPGAPTFPPLGHNISKGDVPGAEKGSPPAAVPGKGGK